LSFFNCASVAATRNIGHQQRVDLVRSGQYHCILLLGAAESDLPVEAEPGYASDVHICTQER